MWLPARKQINTSRWLVLHARPKSSLSDAERGELATSGKSEAVNRYFHMCQKVSVQSYRKLMGAGNDGC